MKKFVSALLCAVTLVGALIVPTSATSPNDESVLLKQETNVTCTLASAAMMLRRRAVIDGNDNWSTITEASMKKQGAWPAGLANKVKYKDSANGLNMQTSTVTLYAMQNNNHKKNTDTATVIKKLKDLLDEHPEGIVLYLYERHLNSKGKSVSSWQHAVLLTSYSDTALYCVDPSTLSPRKEINILDSTLASKSMTNAKTLDKLLAYSVKVWYIKSADNERTKPDSTEVLAKVIAPFKGYCDAALKGFKEVASSITSSDTEKDDTVYAVVYKTSTLNLRKSATTKSSLLASMPKGARVEVLSTTKQNGFYKIKYNGKVGYASANYLDIE